MSRVYMYAVFADLCFKAVLGPYHPPTLLSVGVRWSWSLSLVGAVYGGMESNPGLRYSR